MSRREGTTAARVLRVFGHRVDVEDDRLVTEEPLEIRIRGMGRSPGRTDRVAVTMRTPGDDIELAVGFLFTEGILGGLEDLVSAGHAEARDPEACRNVVEVTLRSGAALDVARLRRNFYMTSSCGVCGKASLESIRVRGVPSLAGRGSAIPKDVLVVLPDRLRERQSLFAATGGLHAAGLFDARGHLLDVREDVGRHNAVDKLVGRQVLEGRTPLHDYGLAVSGRASFEIVQKAAVAGIPTVVAVGAASSLAVELAEEFGMSLVGFLRGRSFTVYTGVERIPDLLPAKARAVPASSPR